MNPNNECAVCSSSADPSISSDFKGNTYVFCSNDCKDEFDKDPEAFAEEEDEIVEEPI